jgi:hypothetical protein
MKRAKF